MVDIQNSGYSKDKTTLVRSLIPASRLLTPRVLLPESLNTVNIPINLYWFDHYL